MKNEEQMDLTFWKVGVDIKLLGDASWEGVKEYLTEAEAKAIQERIDRYPGCEVKVHNGWISQGISLPLHKPLSIYRLVENLSRWGLITKGQGRDLLDPPPFRYWIEPVDGVVTKTIKETEMPFTLCDFQEKGVAWLIQRELTESSMTRPLFFPLSLQGVIGKEPLYICFHSPSEAWLSRDFPSSRSGGFLCDEPGMGKSVQLIGMMNVLGFGFDDGTSVPRSITTGIKNPIHHDALLRYPFARRKEREVFSKRTFEFEETGSTLIITSTSLVDQWRAEVIDKTQREIHIDTFSSGFPLKADVTILSHAMLRAEARRWADGVEPGCQWTCKERCVVEGQDAKAEIEALARWDIVNIQAWGIEWVIDRLDEENIAWGWSLRDLLHPSEGPPQSRPLSGFQLCETSWTCTSSLTLCGEINVTCESDRISRLACASCGAPPSSDLLEDLRLCTPPPLFRVLWRRIILDESDRLSTMPQTLSDIYNLKSQTLWCLTANPNSGKDAFGSIFFDQLALFFQDRRRLPTDISSWRAPGYHEDLIRLWMLQRKKYEVEDQLRLPPVEWRSISVKLEEEDGKEWITGSHARLAKMCRLQVRFSEANLLRIWRLLTVQPDIQSFVVMGEMGLKIKEEKLPVGTCCICLGTQPGGDQVETPCGHVFCQGCIRTWIGTSEKCPTCRQAIPPKTWTLTLPSDHKALKPKGNMSKLRAIETILGDIPSDEKVVISTRFPEAAQMISQVLECPWLHGKLSREKRKEILKGFENDDGPQAMVLNAHLFFFGLNLTRANHLILVDEPPKRCLRSQLIGRLHRIGQTRPVTIYRLVAAGTLEEWIDTGVDLGKILVARF